MRFYSIILVLWAVSLSLLLLVKGFHLKPIRYTSTIESHGHRFWGIGILPPATTRTTKASCTCLKMIEKSYNDPDALLQMVQELTTTQEFTQETMDRMEELQMALTSFVEETSTALMEQEMGQTPKPPSVPPPGALLGMENETPWRGKRHRDLAMDLAQAGTALELLQERLQFEEEALMQAEAAFQEVYDEDATYNEGYDQMQGYEETEDYSLFDKQDTILFEAEEALRKSREAAEKRRLEAEKRSVTNARLSAGYRKQQLQEQVQDQQEIVEKLRDEQAEMDAIGILNQQDVPRTTNRPTMELGNLFGNSETSPRTRDQAPEDIPTLYNWVQNDDGSITGNIKGSINFREGAKISTSCVSEEAQGGTTVATESGSRYYLEKEDFRDDDYQAPTAPDGVPTVKSWEVRSGGGIIGLIYNSPYADDGDYIETSPIIEGDIDNFSVVSTESGSRYFLSGDPPEDSVDNLSAFENELLSSRSTITLPKEDRNERSTFSLFDKARSKRSTFSLFDLFDDRPKNRAMYLKDGPPKPLPPPTPDKIPPEGTPILTGCTFNDDGSITGYVFGSPKIANGILITTSPIVDGQREQFETVTTASGSLYYLG